MGCTIKTIENYIEPLKEQFPKMTDRDLKLILKLGFNYVRKIIAIGADVSLGSKENKIRIRKNVSKKAVLKRMRTDASLKARIKWNRSGKQYDDYYYFAIGKKQFEKIKEKVENKKPITFKKIFLYKAPEECWLRHERKYYFFRVLWPMECGFEIYKDKLTTENYEYLGNEREKSRNKWIQQGPKSRSKPDFTTQQLVELLS